MRMIGTGSIIQRCKPASRRRSLIVEKAESRRSHLPKRQSHISTASPDAICLLRHSPPAAARRLQQQAVAGANFGPIHRAELQHLAGGADDALAARGAGKAA